MKKLIIIICILALAILSVILLRINHDNKQLVYDFEHSFHHDFYTEDGYIVFKDEIRVKNTYSKDLSFSMYTDVGEDYGLVSEETAIACEKESVQKKVFFIKSKSEHVYEVYFKAKKGTKETKQDRLPPKRIDFQILN